MQGEGWAGQVMGPWKEGPPAGLWLLMGPWPAQEAEAPGSPEARESESVHSEARLRSKW